MAKETTVAQLIAWLATQDQGAIVQVVVHRRDCTGFDCEGADETIAEEDLDLSTEDHVEHSGNESREWLLLGGYDRPPR